MEGTSAVRAVSAAAGAGCPISKWAQNTSRHEQVFGRNILSMTVNDELERVFATWAVSVVVFLSFVRSSRMMLLFFGRKRHLCLFLLIYTSGLPVAASFCIGFTPDFNPISPQNLVVGFAGNANFQASGKEKYQI